MKRRRDERGFAMLLVFLMAAMIAITLYMEIPRVSFESQRAKEQLLIERGEQYKRAIQVFVRTNKKYPGSIQELESFNNHRYLRKQYVDPMTGKKEWRLVHIGAGGVFTDSLVNKPKDDKDKDKDKKGDGTTTTTQNFIDPNNPTGQQQPSAVPPRRQSEMGGMVPGGVPGQPGYGVQQQPQIDPTTGQPITHAGMPGMPATVYPTGMPGQVVPGQPYPTQPGQVIPGQPYPGQPYSGQPGQVVPGQPYPTGQVMPGQPYPTQPGQVLPGQPYNPTQPGQVVPGQVVPGQVLGQVVPGQPYPTTMPGAAPGQPYYGGQPGQVVPGQPYGQPGQVVPGQPYGQPGQVVPGQPYYGQPGQVVPGQPGYPYSTQPGAQGGAPPFTQPGMSPAGRGLGTSNDAQKMIQDLLTRPRTGLPSAPAPSVGQQIGGGIAGVASTAEAEGIKVYNEKTNYKEWEFIYDYTKDKGPGAGPQTGAGTPVNQLGTQPGQQPAGSAGQQPATGTPTQQPSPFGAQPGAFPPTGGMPMPPTSR